MMRRLFSVPFLMTTTLLASSASGENLEPNLPAAVTLERCGDVKAEEVQAALAIEYQEEDFGNTMLTVHCWGQAATLRIIGPNHPRGRIADVSLEGVLPVAKSRTIAVLAAELWTAPEAPTASPAPAPAVRHLESMPSSEKARPRHSYRDRLTTGIAVLQHKRSVHAGRTQRSYGAQGSFGAAAIRVDWPAHRWVGIFGQASISGNENMSGHDEVGASVRWRRREVGAYVPVWRGLLRLDLHLSFGVDTITSQGVFVRNSERTLLPRYTDETVGVDLSYPVTRNTTLLLSSSAYYASTTDMDYPNLSGSRWKAGVFYQLRENIRVDTTMETRELSHTDGSTGRVYQDASTSMGVSLQYTP